MNGVAIFYIRDRSDGITKGRSPVSLKPQAPVTSARRCILGREGELWVPKLPTVECRPTIAFEAAVPGSALWPGTLTWLCAVPPAAGKDEYQAETQKCDPEYILQQNTGQCKSPPAFDITVLTVSLACQ
jgi:hypothetical protein